MGLCGWTLLLVVLWPEVGLEWAVWVLRLWGLGPVEGAFHGFVPVVEELLAGVFVHGGAPHVVGDPVGPDFVGGAPEVDGQAGCVGGAKGGVFTESAAYHRAVGACRLGTA